MSSANRFVMFHDFKFEVLLLVNTSVLKHFQVLLSQCHSRVIENSRVADAFEAITNAFAHFD